MVFVAGTQITHVLLNMSYRVHLLAVVFLLVLSGRAGASTLTVERGSDLQAVINYARDGDTLMLAGKSFKAKPTAFIEPLCGNCQDPQTEVRASYGFIVRGKSLVIIGRNRVTSQLVTNAGYGLYFEDSPNSQVLNVTITGGRRDPDGNATDAGIVVRRSRVRLENVDVRDNDHRIDTVVVGIGGIFGREGAEIIIKSGIKSFL